MKDPLAGRRGSGLERTFLTEVGHIAEGEVTSAPAACIPLLFEDKVVGVIAVVLPLLEQKRRFATVDRELFSFWAPTRASRWSRPTRCPRATVDRPAPKPCARSADRNHDSAERLTLFPERQGRRGDERRILLFGRRRFAHDASALGARAIARARVCASRKPTTASTACASSQPVDSRST